MKFGVTIWGNDGIGYSNDHRTIIARAKPPVSANPEPKKWRDMTDAERDDLLDALAAGHAYIIRTTRVSGTVEIGPDGKPDLSTWEASE